MRACRLAHDIILDGCYRLPGTYSVRSLRVEWFAGTLEDTMGIPARGLEKGNFCWSRESRRIAFLQFQGAAVTRGVDSLRGVHVFSWRMVSCCMHKIFHFSCIRRLLD